MYLKPYSPVNGLHPADTNMKGLSTFGRAWRIHMPGVCSHYYAGKRWIRTNGTENERKYVSRSTHGKALLQPIETEKKLFQRKKCITCVLASTTRLLASICSCLERMTVCRMANAHSIEGTISKTVPTYPVPFLSCHCLYASPWCSRG